jgi:hypothetical protein
MIKLSAGGIAGENFQVYKSTPSPIAGGIKSGKQHYRGMNKQKKH